MHAARLACLTSSLVDKRYCPIIREESWRTCLELVYILPTLNRFWVPLMCVYDTFGSFTFVHQRPFYFPNDRWQPESTICMLMLVILTVAKHASIQPSRYVRHQDAALFVHHACAWILNFQHKYDCSLLLEFSNQLAWQNMASIVIQVNQQRLDRLIERLIDRLQILHIGAVLFASFVVVAISYPGATISMTDTCQTLVLALHAALVVFAGVLAYIGFDD